MRALAIPVVLLVAALSGACFQSDTVIHVKADGTGTIEQTNVANQQMIGMAAGMAKQATQQAGRDASALPNLDDLGSLFDEAKLREAASSFGLGVRFVSSAPVTRDGLSGVTATYAFDDVRLLNLSNHPGGSSGGSPMPQVRFDLARAEGTGTSTLHIRLPEGGRRADAPGDAAASPAARPDLPPEALAMVRGMFKGARISVAVDVDGSIVTTDAPKRDGSRVTIFGLDFEQLLSDPTRFSALQGIGAGADFATVRKALDGVPGVVMPATPTVTVEFR